MSKYQVIICNTCNNQFAATISEYIDQEWIDEADLYTKNGKARLENIDKCNLDSAPCKCCGDTSPIIDIVNVYPDWIPISQYPKDEYLTVSRWHKLWKCVVSVVHRRSYTENGCEWLSGTKDNTWPEEAFEPFFMNLPEPPTT